jgi:hypothetical protein
LLVINSNKLNHKLRCQPRYSIAGIPSPFRENARGLPVDVLHDTAAYRIRIVTQLLETLSLGEGISRGALLLQDCARVLAVPLRDGCDLMGVVGRRLQAQV